MAFIRHYLDEIFEHVNMFGMHDTN
jgi:hypothetical protein